MAYIIYNNITGEIFRKYFSSVNEDELVKYQLQKNESYLLDTGIDIETHFVKNNEFVSRPKRPGYFYNWDYINEQWVYDEQSYLDSLKAES